MTINSNHNQISRQVQQRHEYHMQIEINNKSITYINNEQY